MNRLCIWPSELGMLGARRTAQLLHQAICNDPVHPNLANQMCMLLVDKP